jgi:peptidylprolyl isomerase
MSKAQEGDTVIIAYHGLLDDGSTFDFKDENNPLEFVLGENKVLPGLELAVLGMQVGSQKTITIPPEQGYGIHQKSLIDVVDIEALPKDLKLDIGDRLKVKAEDGSVYQMEIIERDSKTVTLDANHPLAGRSLILQIELISLHSPTVN